MTETQTLLWELLMSAQRRRKTLYQIGYRDGLMDAFVAITGRDPEGVYEELQDALVAEHERSIAAQD